MKSFSMITSISFLAVAFLGVARAQTVEECSMSALSAAAAEQLAIFDKDLFLDSDCVDEATPLPVHCNFMGIGQACRGCFTTCAGATAYVEAFVDEIAVWGEDAIINFCPGAEVDTLSECPA